MFAMAAFSSNSYLTPASAPNLSNGGASYDCCCTSGSTARFTGRLLCSFPQVNVVRGKDNGGAGAASRVVIRALAATLHTGGGSVDRNDAASTGPLFRPNPEILLEEAVNLQMEALACNDEPRPDHGLEVMYYFANTEGTHCGSSLPRYFVFPSDLYHFGHLALKFKTRYPELINHSGHELVQIVEEAEEAGDGSCA